MSPRGPGRLALAPALGLTLVAAAAGCGGGDAGPRDAGAPDAGPADACAPASPAPATGLACPAPIVVECGGDRTAVDLAQLGAPTIDEDRCGLDAVGRVLDDLPPDGLPPGESRVRLVATTALGAVLSCETRVEVVDTTPPVVDCPAPFTRVRAAPDEVVAPPPASARDVCDPRVATAVPAAVALAGGASQVRYTVTDGAGNTGSCDVEATVLEAYAAPRFRVLGGALRARPGASDVTDVWLAWEAPSGADVTGFEVERGTAPDGPFEVVGILEAGTRTFLDPGIPAARVFYRLRTLAGPDGLPGGVSDVVDAWAIDGETYDLRDRPVPTIPFDTTLYGVTRWPRALEDGGAGTVGARPLVVLMHGNHGICRRVVDDVDFCTLSTDHECGPFDGFVTAPNAEGLAWLAESLAVQGRVAVTISGNAMNCRGGPGGFNRERSQLLVEHLRQWKTWAQDGGAPFDDRFVERVDLSRVAVFGHSRGGEAVALVPSVLAETPVEGLTLRSVFALAPVDFTDADPSGVPYAVLLPTCDGDVSTLVGMQVYDRVFAADAGAPVAQLAMIGANHNFFNTEWFADDNQFGGTPRTCPVPTGVDGPAQRALLEGAVGDWLAATLDPPGEPAALADWLRADARVPDSLDAWANLDLDVRRAYGAPARVLVEDAAAADAPDTNALGAANAFEGFASVTPCPPETTDTCGGRYAHLRDAIALRWDRGEGDGDAVATLGLDGVDASGRAAVALRVASPGDDLNEGREVWDLLVRLRDGASRTAAVRLSSAEPVPHLYEAFRPFTLLQSVRLPLAAFAAAEPALDLADLTAIELVVDDASPVAGALLVTDVTFPSAP